MYLKPNTERRMEDKGQKSSHSNCFPGPLYLALLQSVYALDGLALLPQKVADSYSSSLKYIEYGFGNILIRSPYTPYFI